MPEPDYALRRSIGSLSSGTRVVIAEDHGEELVVRTLTKQERHSRKGTKNDHIAVMCLRSDLVVLRNRKKPMGDK